MLVEFTRPNGDKISINADAVAYVEVAYDFEKTPITVICISGKEGTGIPVTMDYRLVVEQLQDAMS